MLLLLTTAPLFCLPQDLLPGQERGVPSHRPAQPADVRMPERALHEDQSGGCAQILRAGAWAPGAGYGLVWQDLREGHAGLWLRLLDPAGAPIGADRCLHGHRTSRMGMPALGLARDGSGAVAWLYQIGPRYAVHVRFWGPDGTWLGKDFGLETRQAGRRSTRRNKPGDFEVAVAALPAGGALVAWREGRRIRAQRFNARGKPLDRIQSLSTEATGLLRDLVAEASASGDLRVSWRAGDRTVAQTFGPGGWVAGASGEHAHGFETWGGHAVGTELHLGALRAWTSAGDDPDVWVEAHPGAEPLRLNSDQASAAQDHVSLASAGAQAIAVWEDARSGVRRLMGRRLGQGGAPGPEFELGGPASGSSWPAVALGSSGGSFAVAWKEYAPFGSRVMIQVMGSDGTPLCAPVEVDESGKRAIPSDPPAIVALPDGYAVLWCRAQGGPVLARFDAQGELIGRTEGFMRAGLTCSRPDMVRLPRGDLLAAFEGGARGQGHRVYLARFDSRGGIVGSPAPVPAPHGHAWDPSLAVASDGTSLLAWCAGSPDDRSRDVVAQRFDPAGQAIGPLLPITVRIREQDYPEVACLAGGDFVVAWEGDISGHDHTYLRRVSASGELGPVRTLNGRDAPGPETRTRPLVVALGDGLLTAWGDRRRGRGLDVFVRGLGPGFDGPSDQ